jgi:hypothetical protein
MISTAPWKLAQMVFKPGDGLRIQMVGRLIKQDQIRLGQEQLAQRHAAALAARQVFDRRICRRAAQRIHRLFNLAVQSPTGFPRR